MVSGSSQPITVPSARIAAAHASPQLADQQDEPVVVAVGDMADERRQHQHRHELRDAEQPEIERAAGQHVELPADRHHQHLERQDRHDPPDPEHREGAVAERGPRWDGSVGQGRGPARGALRSVGQVEQVDYHRARRSNPPYRMAAIHRHRCISVTGSRFQPTTSRSPRRSSMIGIVAVLPSTVQRPCSTRCPSPGSSTRPHNRR